MTPTIKKWAESHVGNRVIHGENDCHWICVEFLELTTLKTAPKEITQWRGKYTTLKEANKIAKNLKYEDILEAYNLVEVDQSTKFGDIIRIDNKTRSYSTFAPVLYGKTVIAPNKGKLELSSLDELSKPYRVYRRSL